MGAVGAMAPTGIDPTGMVPAGMACIGWLGVGVKLRIAGMPYAGL